LHYFPAIGSPEHTDNVHSGVNPCATFTGSLTSKNDVDTFTSTTTYESVQFVVLDGPNGAYLQGGGLGSSAKGLFVAKFDPSTGEQIWITYLNDPQPADQWLAFGSIGIIKDGSIMTTAGPMIYKLDAKTGDILNSAEMTVLAGGATNNNFDGFVIAPDDVGTIIMKTQTRPVGCPTQGNGAMTSCQAEYGPQPNTTVVAIDPDTLETVNAILLDQSIVARPIITTYGGLIYMYLSGTATAVRVQWDPVSQELSQDLSWAPGYLQPGGTGGTAPGVLGDWILLNSNVQGGKVPQTITAISQADPSQQVTIQPWGTDAVNASETPASMGVDADNNMFYVQDWLVGGVYAIELNQVDGSMEAAWSRPDWRTSDYFSMVGPADQRVLISQNILESNISLLLATNYSETVLWVNASTGETLAESESTPSTALGSLPNLGYGGRIYMMGNAGSVFIHKVEGPDAKPDPKPVAMPVSKPVTKPIKKPVSKPVAKPSSSEKLNCRKTCDKEWVVYGKCKSGYKKVPSRWGSFEIGPDGPTGYRDDSGKAEYYTTSRCYGGCCTNSRSGAGCCVKD
jgi:hypothetical protein